MAINQVNILDEFKDFAGKYNDTIDEIVISGLVNGSNQLELTKFGGGVITIDLPFSNDKIISGMDITITGAGPYTASVSAGTYQINGVPYTYIGGSFPIGITIFPDERIDILYADTSNNVSYLAGTAGPIPIQPNTPLGTLLIGIIYVNSASAGASAIPTAVAAGFVEGQTLRWNNTTNEWVPTGNLNVSTVGNVGVGTFTTAGARLSVNGAVRLESMTAPFPVTDKLYNVGGTLYWNGIAIGTANLVPGTAIGNTLYWDGTQWNESDEFTRQFSAFSEPFYNYNTTDSTGVFVNVKLGESTTTGARGIEFNVNDTLNTNTADFRLLSQYGSNSATALELIQQDIANDLRSQFLVDPFWMKNEFSLLSDSFNGNFSEDASDHWYKRIGSDVTNTSGIYTDIRQDENNYSVEVNNGTTNNNTFFTQGLTNFTFTKSDSTGVDTEFVAGTVPVAGENGFQFRVNDSLGNNDLYVLMTGQDSLNNKTTFKVNQLDSITSDFSSLALSSVRNEITLLDGTTGNYYETLQTNANGVVNRAVSTAADSFVKVTPGQINLDSYNAITPTTYTSLIQTSTGFQLYSNNSNVNLISNIITSNGRINLNGGLEKRKRITAIATAILDNDWMIVSTAALTVTLPAAPTDGRELVLKARVGTMTINLNGKTMDSVATVTVGNARTIIFDTSLNTWLNI